MYIEYNTNTSEQTFPVTLFQACDPHHKTKGGT